jgi:hypothetical protein
MKSDPHTSPVRHSLRRILPLLAVLAAGILSSCESQEPPVDHTAEIRRLEVRLDEFGEQLLAVSAHADRAAFWQMVAAVLLLAAGIAFVGGAAIGSKARRERTPELTVLADPPVHRENGSRPHRSLQPNHPAQLRTEHPASRLHEPTA